MNESYDEPIDKEIMRLRAENTILREEVMYNINSKQVTRQSRAGGGCGDCLKKDAQIKELERLLMMMTKEKFENPTNSMRI